MEWLRYLHPFLRSYLLEGVTGQFLEYSGHLLGWVLRSARGSQVGYMIKLEIITFLFVWRSLCVWSQFSQCGWQDPARYAWWLVKFPETKFYIEFLNGPEFMLVAYVLNII